MLEKINFSVENTYLLLEHSPVANVMVNSNGEIVYYNTTAQYLFQYNAEELFHQKVEILIPESLRIPHIQYRQTFTASPNPREMGEKQDLFGLRKDGSQVPIEVGLNPISIDGSLYIMASILDISKRIRAIDERIKIEQKVQHAQKLESIGVLAGGIAHDFNNILMGILGNSSFILEDLSHASPIRSQLEQIYNSARKASELTKQLLAYAGKGSYTISIIDVSKMVNELIGILEVSISKRAVLKLDLATSLPYINGDSAQLTQVVMNLITNASDAMEDNDGLISISTSLKDCSKEYLEEMDMIDEITPGSYICLDVSDTGKGMDSKTINKIFDPFYTTKLTGRGLGLAAVQGIIRSHNGCIKVYSELGKGTSFKIFLPIDEVYNETIENIEILPTAQLGTVLLVDDDETVQTSVKAMLEKIGLKVLTALNGNEALQLFTLYQKDIEFLILDYVMPGMQGDEVLLKLREIERDVKVIFSSGYNESSVHYTSNGEQPALFIQKPFTFQELKEIVKIVLASDEKQ